MYSTTQNFAPQTIFGGGYVSEQHGDEMHDYLPHAESHDFKVIYDAMIKALRAALSL